MTARRTPPTAPSKAPETVRGISAKLPNPAQRKPKYPIPKVKRITRRLEVIRGSTFQRLYCHRNVFRVCPLLCLLPTPTKCDGCAVKRGNALIGVAFVAIRSNSSQPMQLIDFSLM